MKLSPTVVSAKYFDMDFPTGDYGNWYDIKTPTLDRILDYQGFPRDVKECIMYFIGRMLYNVSMRKRSGRLLCSSREWLPRVRV